MFKKIFTIITIIYTSMNAYAYAANNELKAFAFMLVKFFVGVLIAIIIIALFLLLYKKFKFDYLNQNLSYNEEHKCEIDEAHTIDEAINTFLRIN